MPQLNGTQLHPVWLDPRDSNHEVVAQIDQSIVNNNLKLEEEFDDHKCWLRDNPQPATSSNRTLPTPTRPQSTVRTRSKARSEVKVEPESEIEESGQPSSHFTSHRSIQESTEATGPSLPEFSLGNGVSANLTSDINISAQSLHPSSETTTHTERTTKRQLNMAPRRISVIRPLNAAPLVVTLRYNTAAAHRAWVFDSSKRIISHLNWMAIMNHPEMNDFNNAGFRVKTNNLLALQTGPNGQKEAANLSVMIKNAMHPFKNVLHSTHKVPSPLQNVNTRDYGPADIRRLQQEALTLALLGERSRLIGMGQPVVDRGTVHRKYVLTELTDPRNPPDLGSKEVLIETNEPPTTIECGATLTPVHWRERIMKGAKAGLVVTKFLYLHLEFDKDLQAAAAALVADLQPRYLSANIIMLNDLVWCRNIATLNAAIRAGVDIPNNKVLFSVADYIDHFDPNTGYTFPELMGHLAMTAKETECILDPFDIMGDEEDNSEKDEETNEEALAGKLENERAELAEEVKKMAEPGVIEKLREELGIPDPNEIRPVEAGVTVEAVAEEGAMDIDPRGGQTEDMEMYDASDEEGSAGGEMEE